MFDRVTHVILRVLLFIIFVLLLVYLFHWAGEVGYSVFADEPYDSSQNAAERLITVTDGEKLLDISRDLERYGIVKNAYITAMSFRTMEGYDRIRPGEYMVKASMKPSEIMTLLVGEKEQ